MTKKKILFGVSVAAFSLVASFVAYAAMTPQEQYNFSSSESYSITLDKDNVPAGLTSSYQNNVATTVKSQKGTDINLNIVNGKTSEGNLVELAGRGMIYNFGAKGERGNNSEFAGLSSVKAKFSGGKLFVRTAKFGQAGGVELGAPQELTSETACPVTTTKYFQIVAEGSAGVTIEYLTLNYTCDAEEYDIKNLDGTYTGEGNDGYTYKLSLAAGAATIESLDMASNISINGTATMNSATQVSCAFTVQEYPATYVSNVSADGQKLTFVSKSGAGAAGIPQIDFYKVYTVENFESYTATGTGYVSSAAKYTTYGLRAAYYADYYTGSGSGEIGGSGWPIMTSTDNSNYNSQKGHNSSKVGIFKFSNGSGMRYISMNELYGVEQVIGKGTKISLWARGAYTNANFNTDHASNTPMKLYAYYATPLTPSTQTTARETFDFEVVAGATWQHFEFDLTPGRIYYGFGFYAKQTSGSTQYVPLDDIEIYTYSPYAEYSAPVAVTGVSVSPTALNLEEGQSSTLVATVSPSDATNKNVAWSSNNTSVATVDNDGNVTAVTAGNATITVTANDGGYTADCAVTVTASSTEPYPEGTYNGSAMVNTGSGENEFTITLAIGNKANGLVAVRLSNKDAEATGITYNESSHQVSITTTGSYMGLATYGTITGTFDVANNRITGIACSGTISSYVTNNGSIVATKLGAGVLWDCDGTTSQLQSTFKRRYMSGSWQVDNTNADRITSNTTEYVSGTGGLKRRAHSTMATALNFNSDFSPAKSVANVHFWVYNPSGSDIKIRMWYYQATNFGSNGETGSVTAKAGQWTYLAMGFGPDGGGNRTVYNFQIAVFHDEGNDPSGTYLTFDNIALF